MSKSFFSIITFEDQCKVKFHVECNLTTSMELGFFQNLIFETQGLIGFNLGSNDLKKGILNLQLETLKMDNFSSFSKQKEELISITMSQVFQNRVVHHLNEIIESNALKLPHLDQLPYEDMEFEFLNGFLSFKMNVFINFLQKLVFEQLSNFEIDM
jgi:hypothetical protein